MTKPSANILSHYEKLTKKELIEELISFQKKHSEEDTINQLQSENTYLFLDYMDAGIIVQEASGEISIANKKACDIFRMKKEEVEGKYSMDPVWNMVDENEDPVKGEDHPSMITMRTGEAQKNVIRGLFADNPQKLRWLLINTHPFKTVNNNVEKVIVTFIDVTNQYIAEKRLKQETSFNKTIIQTANSIVLGLDKNATIILFNNYAERVTGYKAEEVLNKNWFDIFIPGVSKKSIKKIFREVWEGKDLYWGQENMIRCKDGSELWLSWRNSRIKNEKGKVEYILSLGADITETRIALEQLKKQNQEIMQQNEEMEVMNEEVLQANSNLEKTNKLLTESESKFHSLFSNIHEAFALHEIVLDNKGEPVDFIYIDVNPAFEEITKFKRDDIIGKKGLDVIPDLEKKWIKKYGKVALGGKPVTFTDHSNYLDKYWEVRVFSPGKLQFATLFTDVTIKVNAEKQLQKSRNELDFLLKSMINAFVIFDSVFDKNGKFISYRFVYINDAYEKITGVKNSEVKGKTVHEVWPETEPEWIKRYGEVAVSGMPQNFDLFHKPTNKLYHCHVYRPWDTNEKFCVIFEDVTQQRDDQKKLREKSEEIQAINEELSTQNEELTETYQKISKSEQLYRNLVETASDPIYLMDRDGKIINVNKQAVKLLGYDYKELIKMDIGQVDTNFPTAKFLAFWKDKPLETPFIFETTHKTAEGENIPVEVSAMKFLIEESIHYYGIARDLRERKKTEQELEAIFNMSLHMICIADINTATFTKINPAFNRILGYSSDELLNKSFMSFIHPDDIEDTRQIIDKKLKRGETVLEFINRYKCKDGSYRTLDWVSRPVPEFGITYAIANDITERKKAEEELLKYRLHLEKLVDERTQEIQEKNEQLERMNKLFVGREFRIKELRDQVKDLKKQLGE